MTQEQFEKAQEIQRQLEVIDDIRSVLSNSVGPNVSDVANRYLAAVLVTGDSPSGTKVLNHVRVPEEIYKQFNTILWSEHEKLCKEFDKL